MKKIFMAALCSLVLTFSAACGASSSSQAQTDTNGMQIPDPFTEYASLEDAQRDAGFDITLPETVAGSDSCVYRVLQDEENGSMLEVIYQSSGQETGRIRKAEGSGDISGDYNEYDEVKQENEGGMDVTLSGGSDGYVLAVWENDDCTYAISLREGVTQEEMNAVIGQVR